MKKMTNKPEIATGVFSRSQKARKKLNYKPVESQATQKKKVINTTSKGNLKIIPIGGIEEIGKNMTVFEYEDEMIIVDCGVAFPEDEMLGIDLVIPDFTYLEKNREKIKAGQCPNLRYKAYMWAN